MISIETAERLASVAHAGQVTSLGDPRFEHVMRVAARVATGGDELTVVAAILHDAVEKGGLDWDDLLAAGASPELMVILDLLTERDGEAEDAYLGRCASHPIARRVKEADLRDGLEGLVGGTLPPETVEGRRRRAARRLAVLQVHGDDATSERRTRQAGMEALGQGS